MLAMTDRKIFIPLFQLLALVIVLVVALPGQAATPKKAQKSFGSPEEAVKGLVAAVKNHDRNEALAILGPDSPDIVNSGDPVADRAGQERFVRLYEENNVIEGAESGKATLIIGNEAYPFPIPLVKKGKKWRFDTRAGKEEILNRRIGRNELDVIDVMRAYVEAQREYASKDRGGGSMAFAQKIRSTPGKKDGLYWKAGEGEEESPLGPLAAKAAGEGYKTSGESPIPFHGYYFRILKAQGKDADGGAFNYVVNGSMILGFAMVAYPAHYGSSGIMTFMVNQNGVVYQKDLGKDTPEIAAAMKLYNPDKSWKKVE